MTSHFTFESRVDLISATLILSVGNSLHPPVVNIYGKHLVLSRWRQVAFRWRPSPFPPSWPQPGTGDGTVSLTLSVSGEDGFAQGLQPKSVGARHLIPICYQGSSRSRLSLRVKLAIFPEVSMGTWSFRAILRKNIGNTLRGKMLM